MDWMVDRHKYNLLPANFVTFYCNILCDHFYETEDCCVIF